MMTDPDVLIVGAGPAGLTLALLLAEHDVPVEVVDPKSGPVQETRASVLHPRTVEVLAPLGLAPDLLAGGHRVQAYDFRVHGRYVGQIPYSRRGAGRTPFPFDLTFTQDQLERLLVQRLVERGIDVDRGWRGTAVRQDADGVTAVVEHGDGRERTVRARWLVAADGARSAVRDLCAIPFHGRVDAKTYLVADMRLTPPLSRHRGIFNFLDDGSVSVYPRAEAGTFRVTAVLNSGSIPGDLTDEETMHRVVEERSGLGVAAGAITWVSSTVVQHRIADTFHRGRVLLVGDAARAHSPFGGQGMNNAVQDAVNLAWKLALTVRGTAGDHLPRSLTEERRPPSLRITRSCSCPVRGGVCRTRRWRTRASSRRRPRSRCGSRRSHRGNARGDRWRCCCAPTATSAGSGVPSNSTSSPNTFGAGCSGRHHSPGFEALDRRRKRGQVPHRPPRPGTDHRRELRHRSRPRRGDARTGSHRHHRRS